MSQSEKEIAKFRLRHEIELLLNQSGLSASQLARACNMPYTTLASWLEGRMPRNIDQLSRVAKYFGVTIETLCYGAHHIGHKNEEVMRSGVVGVFEVKLLKVIRNKNLLDD